MEWIIYILGYLAIGSAVLALLFKFMKIKWERESLDTKAWIVVTPVAWPVVVILVASVWMFKK
jgi:hypothetical protein